MLAAWLRRNSRQLSPPRLPAGPRPASPRSFRKLVAENHDLELLELLRAAAEQDEREDASEGEVDEPGEQSRPPCRGKSARLYEDIVSACSLGDPQSLSRS